MDLKGAILKTLSYHSIFDYPLKKSELKNLLIEYKCSTHSLTNALDKLVSSMAVVEKDDYYCLRPEQNIISIRARRKQFSQNKLKKVERFASILRLIPTVKLVAITGALAMQNCTQGDDIDLMLITSKNALWTTRLLSNLLLLPYKRSPKSKSQKDKACLNIFIDKADLKIKDENLYTAHEIAQMKPIYERSGTYAKFIRSNNWIYKYLPNWKPEKVPSHKSQVTSRQKRGFIIYSEKSFAYSEKSFAYNLSLITERALRSLQLYYMRSKVTTETIGDTQLFFHPKDTQKHLLVQYKKKLRRLGLERLIDIKHSKI